MTLGIRPEDLKTDAAPMFSGTVTVAEPLGSETLVYVDVNGQEIIATAPGRTPPKAGDAITLGFSGEDAHVFDPDSGVSLRAG